MKKSLTIILVVIVSTFTAFAQNSKDEQQVLKVHNSLNQAFLNKDITVFERVLADDYVYSGQNGKMSNRAQNLDGLRQGFTNSNYKELGLTNENVKVKVSGNMAFVTGNWTLEGVAANDANAEPHKNTGRLTAIYEKRRGKWLMVAEHYSEAPHDRKLMEQQVLKAGQEYAQMIKNQDAAAIERILADEYIYTNEKGKVQNKTENLASYKTNQYKFETNEISDRKVRVIGNGVAVETGSVRYKGTNKDNKPFEGSERYTTTWVWRGGRWQIVADHTSEIKQ
jgi:ketosteroid isomerase-like protein